VIAGAGLDAQALAARAETAAAKDALRANTEEAVARGVFGAPALFFAGELYFGVDHLPHLERALEADASRS
jgi:2-hydroxychromene-2-carboxylate isomerase